MLKLPLTVHRRRPDGPVRGPKSSRSRSPPQRHRPVRPADIVRAGGRDRVVVEEEEVELVRLDRVLALPAGRALARLPVLVLRSGVRPLAWRWRSSSARKRSSSRIWGLPRARGAVLGGDHHRRGAGHPACGSVAPRRGPESVPPADGRPSSRGSADPRENGRPGRPRILLVDDSISVRKFVGQMLEKASFEVITANDGAEALRRLDDTTVDLVITDLEMPRVNGYELIEDLRARAARAPYSGDGAHHAGGGQARGSGAEARHPALRRQAGGGAELRPARRVGHRARPKRPLAMVAAPGRGG